MPDASSPTQFNRPAPGTAQTLGEESPPGPRALPACPPSPSPSPWSSWSWSCSNQHGGCGDHLLHVVAHDAGHLLHLQFLQGVEKFDANGSIGG